MAVVTAAIIGASIAVAGSAVGAISAHQGKQRAKGQMMTAQRELEELELNRQDVINPYEDVENLSDLVSDVSGMASNPFANLAVSTAAAEMQIEEADIALANTLDTLRATGASAGGATALARMALESKKGVSASIEQQEANNQKMRASGEQRLQGIEMNEAKRVQNTNLSQAEKVQKAEVEGAIYEFETQESRDEQQLNRKQGQINNAEKAIQGANAQKAGAINAGVSAVGNIAGGLFSR
jgi:chemotaxis response regulator CheB